MSSRKCFICLSQKLNSKSKFGSEHERAPRSGFLDHQLDVVFILKHILEFDSELLGAYLRRCGNPGNWVHLCGECSVAIHQIRRVFTRLQEISREFEKRKFAIREKFGNSGTPEESSEVSQVSGRRVTRRKENKSVSEEADPGLQLRKLYFTRGLPQVKAPPRSNPYCDGDTRAGKLCSRESDPQSQDSIILPVKTEPEHSPSPPPEEEYNEPPSPVCDLNTEDDFSKASELFKDNNQHFVSHELVREHDEASNPNSNELTIQKEQAELDVINDNVSSIRPRKGSKRVRLKSNRPAKNQVRVRDKSSTALKKVSVRQKRELPKGPRRNGVALPEDGECVCEQCGQILKSSKRLLIHKNAVHLRKYEKTCEICGVTCPKTDAFEKHMANKHGIGKFRCSEKGCSKAFRREIDLDVHKIRKHGHKIDHASTSELETAATNAQLSSCKVCGKAFQDERSMALHYRLVHSDPSKTTPRVCDICGLVLKGNNNLMDHRATKHGIGKYKCEFCGKAFHFQCLYDLHKKIPCRSSTMENAIKAEEQVEAGERSAPLTLTLEKFKCDICQKEFPRKGAVGRHKKFFHEKKFTHFCKSCNKGFRHKYDVDKHNWRIHKIADLKCEVVGCDMTFFRVRHLEDHVKQCHPAQEGCYGIKIKPGGQ